MFLLKSMCICHFSSYFYLHIFSFALYIVKDIHIWKCVHLHVHLGCTQPHLHMYKCILLCRAGIICSLFKISTYVTIVLGLLDETCLIILGPVWWQCSSFTRRLAHYYQKLGFIDNCKSSQSVRKTKTLEYYIVCIIENRLPPMYYQKMNTKN